MRSCAASAAPANGSRWQGFDAMPDLMTFAKGVNSGYVPVGGVLISDSIANAFDTQVFRAG